MAQQDRIDPGAAPLNPFIAPHKEKLESQNLLSPLQQQIARFIEDEARSRTSKTAGVQPPAIKIFGPDALAYQQENERKQTEFFEKYKISRSEHDHLSNLVFFGELKLPFQALGHTFLIRDMDVETRRYLLEIQDRVQSYRALETLKVIAVGKTLVEIDGIPLNKNFLEQFVWRLQHKLVDSLHRMHILTERYKMYLYEKLPNFCRTPTSRVRYALCRDLKIPINDPMFLQMSEEQIYWHYINTLKHDEIENDLTNSRLEYLAWFINPELAKKVEEKKEMAEESESNLQQKYSFMNGIMDMIKNDMNENEVANTMGVLMDKMKKSDDGEKDPWAEPEPVPGLDPNDPFMQGLKKKAQNIAESQSPPMGMIGGDPSWYRKDE